MEKRSYGTNPMAECKHDANEKVDRNKRYQQILNELKRCKKGLTAKEIAVRMNRKHLIPDADRNHVSPRLTELMEKGKVEPVGKVKCEYTGHTVTVFQLRDEE